MNVIFFLVKKLFSLFVTIALLAIVVGCGYIYTRTHLEYRLAFDTLTFNAFKVKACAEPLTYTVRAFDERFHISEETFEKALKDATGIWEKAYGKTLFRQSTDGQLVINLIYDERQAATVQTTQVHNSIQTIKQTSDSVSKEIATLKAQFDATKIQYEKELASYEAAARAYDQRVKYWNDRGGAPKAEYQSLNQEKESMRQRADALEHTRIALNNLRGTLNARIDTFNSLVKNTNEKVSQYNSNEYVGREFEEGEYRYERRGLSETQEINIYEFKDYNKLVRVLTHELGHALGLDHNENPKSLMYRLNTSANQIPTKEDMSALRELCGVNSEK